MNTGRSLLSQILTYMPKYQFDKIIEKYKGNNKAQEFSCWEQYVCMVFAQLTYRESLRDIESCLEAFGSKLYHCGIRLENSRVLPPCRHNDLNVKMNGEWGSALPVFPV